nr:unnamed protein product [Digitaria exilis]
MHPKSAQRLLLIVTAGIVAIICRLSPATAAAASPHHSQQSRQNNVGTSCIPHERDALLTLKQGITKDPYGLLDSWRGGDKDCCHWRGVRCSNRTGHVLKLELRNVHAARDDDYDQVKSTALVGQISHALLFLDRLFHLDLSMNYLNGSSGRIPEFLSSMVSLRYLNLSGIPYSGRVPPHLGNLSKLQNLDLSGVFYERSMYSTDISWNIDAMSTSLKKLCNLTVLDLSWCFLNGRVGQLASLSTLDLSGNLFSGHVPSAID